MKRAAYLFHKITTFENLLLAVKKASRGKKGKSSVARFVLDVEKEVFDIQESLLTKSYRPAPYHQFKIYEPKERNICSSQFRDRVVHHAICNVIEPFLEKRLIHDSYACRTGKGSHLAIDRCQEFARRSEFYLKCDIAKYFESIDHRTMKKIVRKLFKDPEVIDLLDLIINHSMPGAPPGKGLPIGNLTSQHLANLYLGELDHHIKEKLRVPYYLRYMDDFISFSESKEFLNQTLNQIEAFVGNELQLSLKQKATIIAPVSEGVPFLGFRIFKSNIRMQRQNVVRLRSTIKQKERAFQKGKITEAELIQSLGSVHAHVEHANVHSLLSKEVLRSLKMA